MTTATVPNVALKCYNQNSAQNAQCVSINDVDFYFSYQTIVAVRYRGALIVHENIWSNTTGKHLNWIDGGNKSDRVDAESFAIHLKRALGWAGVSSLKADDLPF